MAKLLTIKRNSYECFFVEEKPFEIICLGQTQCKEIIWRIHPWKYHTIGEREWFSEKKTKNEKIHQIACGEKTVVDYN